MFMHAASFFAAVFCSRSLTRSTAPLPLPPGMRALLLACAAAALGAAARSPRAGLRQHSATLSSEDAPVVAAARRALDRAEARVAAAAAADAVSAAAAAPAQPFGGAAELSAPAPRFAELSAATRPSRPAGYPDNAAGTALFMIDLCFLAYGTWAQSLVQPMNAFFNAKDSSLSKPDEFDAAVRRFARLTVKDPVARGSCGDVYAAPAAGYAVGCTGAAGLGQPTLLRGPWRLLPSDDISFGEDAVQTKSEPILYRYSAIKPEQSVVAASKPGAFRAYMSPLHITSTIGATWVTMPIDSLDYVDVQEHKVHEVAGPTKSDIFVAFEGSTGIRDTADGEQRSLIGFVLGRKTSETTFEVHVTFRGTRSERMSPHLRRPP